ncbi:MAG: 50S ribosomal protein L1, partial [Hasllibacter sp.]
MAKLTKKQKEQLAAVEGKSNVTVSEAVALVKGNAKAKFDETIEVAM